MKRFCVSFGVVLTVGLIVSLAWGSLAYAEGGYSFVAKWGSEGSGDGQFSWPEGIALDASDNVYVVDVNNYRIQKFDSSGTFITKWGSKGSGDGQFRDSSDIDVDASGNVYVVDAVNGIQKFDSLGTFASKLLSYDGLPSSPVGIAVDASRNVYVLDASWFNEISRVEKFDSSGTFITTWGSYGSGDGQFIRPRGIAVDPTGYVYVLDSENSRIQKFDSSGTFITKWGSYGSGDGQFLELTFAIGVDSLGNVYVGEWEWDGFCRIQKFDSSGTFITKWGSCGSGDGQLMYPNALAIDASGNVYVADGYLNRITKFAPTVINGICGPADGGTFPSAPTTNLCSTGTPSAVAGTGPWTWTCQGLNGGTDASCSADLAVTTCHYKVSTTKPAKYKGGAVSLKVVADENGCLAPTVSDTSDWIEGLLTKWANGKGTVKVSVGPNSVASERSAEITVGDTPVTITQQAAPCKLSTFTPKKNVIAVSGGAGSFTFSLAQGCGWTAAPDEKGATWLTLDTVSGDGSGVIDYSAAANTTGKPLSGKIIVTVIPTGKAKKYSVKQEK